MPPPYFLSAATRLRTEMEAVGAVESNQPDFVVAGIDLSLPLQRLSDAVVHVRNGAQLIVTNPDLTVPIEGGLRAGAGAVQAFIEASAAAEAANHRQAASGYLPASALLDGPRGA